MSDRFSGYSRIRAERDGTILTLMISNPALRNAVDEQMHHELASIFVDAQEDADSTVIVLTGDPEGNAFCAGGDIAWMKAALDGTVAGPGVAEGRRIVTSLLDVEKPIVAAINGPAVGLGATLALFSDVIFMGESAQVADPHVKVGLVAGDGGAVIWPQLVGYARAKEYLMTGDPVPAAEAERIGLVNHVVPDAELQERAMAFARKLARGAPQAIQHTKAAVNMELKRLAATVFDASLAYEMISFTRDDHREAVSAFLEKRAPAFTGR
ncbi:enoyl-CoA hydratase/isomerase family protein [Pyruvatibacter mobilis]|jgi:enoyl-CoA hydratase|uniref:Enoyl-CoA hydratase/isomerase family protein n=1 Tax=Pyruvatibacter mobilis TaxID=1712261 RepID=A0A845Q4D4_9HYPH|nr:enoyl-CoA hydratase-related protein [Pyruvatibacter mobilis]NBG94137.1 enoyl-CoA hydratase/isomerase family protein [Pyruvatibacter mobilis]QJD76447.1 enoyl-CoA hydratase/isomerase family protein [Pyruvatibacter mobilis]GGD00663.1 enoyl-CoA hydratase [Pyruvatibacter mobilis]